MAFTDAQPRTRIRLSADASRPATKPVHPRGRLVIAGVAVVVLAAAGVVLALLHHSPRATPTQRAAPPATATTSPSTVAGVPVGYPDTEAGAKAAAANYVVAFASESMFDASARHAIIAAVSDPTVVGALQQQYDAAFQATMSRFGLSASGQPPHGQQFVARALPVGVHVDAYDSTAARVSVWSDGLIGLAGAQSKNPVAEAWTTTTVSLRWVDGDWKWVTATQHDGPTPVSGLQSPSTADQIAQATQMFTGMRYAP